MQSPAAILTELDQMKTAHTLPGRYYSDPDIFQLDMENIWYRDWLFVGHDCEIPKAGNFFTLQLGAYPVVVLRGRDGAIRAFHNACRHRGSKVCTTESGSKIRLVCPYHQWTYELDGKLMHARDMGPDFDPSAHSLKSVHCESVGGYIWICVAKVAPDFGEFHDRVAPYFAPHNLTDAKVAHSSTIIEKGNWKLVWENNRECYHCAGSHPELCRTFDDDPTISGVGSTEDAPIVGAHWRRCEAAGLPSKFHLGEHGQYRTARMPLAGEAVSYTMSGEAAVSRPLSDAVTEPNIGTLLLFHYPSTWNHILGDHAVTFRVLPISPTETMLTTKWLVHKDAVEGRDYDLDTLTRVWNATNLQDRKIVEDNQIGCSSPAYEPGPYSPVHEDGVIQFVEWYTGALKRSLSGDTAKIRRIA
jgi:Rieske 2Fe-2S family protein